MPTSSAQHTLFLWPQANFPRRLTYYLILKNLVSSPKDILINKTTVPNLTIRTISIDPTTHTFKSSDPNDPFPEGKRHPLLRITSNNDKTVYIHESRSIMEYLEATFPGPELCGGNSLARATNSDYISIIDEAIGHIANYAKHSSKTAWQYFQFPENARSQICAVDSLGHMNKSLLRLQDWAISNGTLSDDKPWLSVGGPGVADVCLIAWWRYVQLAFDLDVLEDEPLGALRGMREAFVRLEWWEEAENQVDGVGRMEEWEKKGRGDLEF